MVKKRAKIIKIRNKFFLTMVVLAFSSNIAVTEGHARFTTVHDKPISY